MANRCDVGPQILQLTDAKGGDDKFRAGDVEVQDVTSNFTQSGTLDSFGQVSVETDSDGEGDGSDDSSAAPSASGSLARNASNYLKDSLMNLTDVVKSELVLRKILLR